MLLQKMDRGQCMPQDPAGLQGSRPSLLPHAPVHPQEGTKRPLAWRIIASPKFEAAYVARYRELASSILSESYLTSRIESLAALVEPVLTDALTGERRSGPTTEIRYCNAPGL